MASRAEKIEAFGRLMDILDILRVQCPWDAKQTNQSLRPNTIEEVYELSQAILDENASDIKKELGDVLLHILFYAKIGEEQSQFDIKEVCDAISDKLIFRHPHVFADTSVSGADEVEKNWEQIKLREKGGNKTVMGGVPRGLPALVKAQRIQEKAANVGFDWQEREDVWDKVQEEIGEFQAELMSEREGSTKHQEEELGDLFFSLINAARLYKLNADSALERANAKFIRRFSYIEQKAKESDTPLSRLTLEQMEELYQEAKRAEREEAEEL